MREVIKKAGMRIVLDDAGVHLQKGLRKREVRFLPWSDIAAVGFAVMPASRCAPNVGGLFLMPEIVPQSMTLSYEGNALFVYFSVFRPQGFKPQAIGSVFAEPRNICFYAGGLGALDRTIFQIAATISRKIRTCYRGDILNEGANPHFD